MEEDLEQFEQELEAHGLRRMPESSEGPERDGFRGHRGPQGTKAGEPSHGADKAPDAVPGIPGIPENQPEPEPLFNAEQLDAINNMISSEVEKRIELARAQMRLERDMGKFDLVPDGEHIIEELSPEPEQQDKNLWKATADATWNSTDSIWEVTAERVNQGGTTDASTSTTKEAIGASGDEPPVLEGDVCVEVDTAEGRRLLSPLGGGEQLNHSFLPTDNGDGTFDITPGVVYLGGIDIDDGTTPAPLATLPATTTSISITTNTHFQIKIDWTSNFLEPDVSWEAGTSFGTNTDRIHYYPILEFGTAGDFGSLIRRQTGDLHIPNYPIPALWATASGAVLVWDQTNSKLEWKHAPTTGKYALTVNDGVFGWTELTTFECPT